MEEIIDITELDFNNDFGEKPKFTKSTNFGSGIELLMNDKVKEGSRPTSDFDLEDLNNLENELNGLVDDMPSSSYKSKSDMFGGGEDKQSVKFNDNPTIGQSTADYPKENKTWERIPEREAVIRRIFKMSANGDGKILIARKLNKQQILDIDIFKEYPAKEIV